MDRLSVPASIVGIVGNLIAGVGIWMLSPVAAVVLVGLPVAFVAVIVLRQLLRRRPAVERPRPQFTQAEALAKYKEYRILSLIALLATPLLFVIGISYWPFDPDALAKGLIFGGFTIGAIGTIPWRVQHLGELRAEAGI